MSDEDPDDEDPPPPEEIPITPLVMTSPDGITWTAYEVEYKGWFKVVHGNGVWVAVCQEHHDIVMVSNDGATWTTVSVPGLSSPADITFGNGIFLIISMYAGEVKDNLYTSTDGENWTTLSHSFPQPPDSYIHLLAYGNGVFVDLGISYLMEGITVQISADGTTAWSSVIFPAELQIENIASLEFLNGQFVVTGNASPIFTIVTSTDGVTWSAQTVNPGFYANKCLFGFGDGIYCIIPDVGTACLTSVNGTTWNPGGVLGQPVNALWNGVKFGAGKFVAISNRGDVATSPNGDTWTNQTSALPNIVGNGGTELTDIEFA